MDGVERIALAHRQAPQGVRQRAHRGRRLRPEPGPGQLQQEARVLRGEASGVAELGQLRGRLDGLAPPGVATTGKRGGGLVGKRPWSLFAWARRASIVRARGVKGGWFATQSLAAKKKKKKKTRKKKREKIRSNKLPALPDLPGKSDDHARREQLPRFDLMKCRCLG